MRSLGELFLALSLITLLGGTISPSVDAQVLDTLNMELIPPSQFATGCAPPSPCDCLVELVGVVEGSFVLDPILPPLGPLFEYTVENINWTVIAPTTISPPPTTVTGNGIYVRDLINGTHSMDLTLVLDGGPPRTFTSGGFVPGTDDTTVGPLDIYVYSQVDSCIYDGITISAIPAIGDTFFRRGDCNGDASYNIGDPIKALDHLFSPLTVVPNCVDACDANDDGLFNIADPVFMLNNQFAGGPPPPPPFGPCGPDPTIDPLGCIQYNTCL